MTSETTAPFSFSAVHENLAKAVEYEVLIRRTMQAPVAWSIVFRARKQTERGRIVESENTWRLKSDGRISQLEYWYTASWSESAVPCEHVVVGTVRNLEGKPMLWVSSARDAITRDEKRVGGVERAFAVEFLRAMELDRFLPLGTTAEIEKRLG